MNRINIDNKNCDTVLKKIYSNTNIYIKESNVELNLEIKDDCDLFIYVKDSNLKINYDVEAVTNIYIFNVNSSVNSYIGLNKEFALVSYFYSNLNTVDNEYRVYVKHNCSNTKSKVVNNGLNLTDSKLYFKVYGEVINNASDVVCNQESKIIVMDDNNSLIEPNLIIDNYSTLANHSAYIGHFKKNELFYLESRGISEDDSKKILSKAFLFGNMNVDFSDKDLILKDFNEFWR